MIRRATLLLLVAASLAACSSEPKNNDTDNNSTNNNAAVDMGNTFVDVDNTGSEYAMQYSLLFDSLAFTTQPLNQLNMLLNANFDQNLEYPVLVLIQLSEVDAEAGTLRLEGGSGLKTDTAGEFIYDPESNVDGADGTLDGSSGEFSADLDFFGFVATFVTENEVKKTVLPINELTIGGQLALQDGGASASVANGTLSGYMTKADADITEITLAPGGAPITLTQVFKENTLNYDSATGEMVEAGMGDSWFLEGTYSAVPTVITE